MRKDGFHDSVCLSLSSMASLSTITFERIIGLDCTSKHCFKGTNRKDDFVKQPFLTKGFSFIYIKIFSKNQKFNFPAKIYEIRKKFKEMKFFISKRSTIMVLIIFPQELYPLFINEKYYKKVKIIFLRKTTRDTKKMLRN